MRLTKQQWVEARLKWESDPRTGYDWLAKELDVSRPAVAKKAAAEAWKKVTPKVTPKVTQPKKVTQEVTPKVTQKSQLLPAKVGRPTKYKPEYCQMIIDYFSDNDAYDVLEHPDDDTKRKAFIKRPITLYGFAQKIGVDDETLRNWAEMRNEDGVLENPEFFASYRRALSMQAKQVLEGGMSGVYNSNVVALTLKNLHGFKDVVTNNTEVYISKDTEDSLNKLYELRVSGIKDAQTVIEGRFERIISK